MSPAISNALRPISTAPVSAVGNQPASLPAVDDNAEVVSLIVVTGPPGAGKSTVAALLAERLERSVLVEGDAFFRFLRSGAVAPWLPEAHEQNTVVTHAGGAAAGRYARGGFNTVYDGVIGPWFLDDFLAATGLTSLDYAILLPAVEVCVERVGTRLNHGFSDEAATRHMHHEFARSQYKDRHVIRATNDSPGVVADHIRAARNEGALTYTSK